MESERRVGMALAELTAAQVLSFLQGRPNFQKLGIFDLCTAVQRESLVIATKVCDECEPFSDNGGHDAFSGESCAGQLPPRSLVASTVVC